MQLIRSILLTWVTIAGVVLSTTSVAGADCAGPSLDYSGGDVAPGDSVEVLGTGWGDNCYDSGDPPRGEGVLGKPLQDIEIFVTQDGFEELVATGNADADYQFTVTVTVPSTLAAGKFSIEARADFYEGFDYSETPLVFVPTDDVVEAAVASFDPPAATADTALQVEAPNTDRSGAWFMLGALALVAVVVGSGLLARRGRT